MEGILAITFIFGGGSLFLLAISPIGKAIANRISGGSLEEPSREFSERFDAAHRELLEEVEHLREDVIEMQERLDFAERLLAQSRQGALPAADEPGAAE